MRGVQAEIGGGFFPGSRWCKSEKDGKCLAAAKLHEARTPLKVSVDGATRMRGT